MAAAAELIMQQDREKEEGCDSSDEGFGGEESECEEGVEEMETTPHPGNNSLADSGYGGVETPLLPRESTKSR